MSDKPLEKTAFQFDFDAVRNADVYLRWGFENVGGTIVRGFVGLELEVNAWRFTVLHYDNSHGQQFHRHSAGFPHSGHEKTNLGHWQPNNWISFAKEEVKANWLDWVNSVVPTDVIQYMASQGAVIAGPPATWDEDKD